jgi:N-acetylglucosamine-6-phosphate deacetylase
MTRKGFVDLQVNGYMGVDFSSAGLQRDDIHRVTDALLKAGTIGYCATLITSDLEVYRRNLPLIAAAMEEPGIKNRLLGIHMEGPFLSPEEGAHGAHAKHKMRLPDASEFDRFQEWARGNIAILTVAPELPGCIDFIRQVRSRHATKISVGHHLASGEILRQAADAGATLSTHLGNGCPNFLPRHENVLVYQLANDSLTAGLITDGNHLPPDFLKIALRCKGPDRVFIVSDSAPIASFEPGIYETLGNRVRLTEGGRIESLQAQHLVGSGCNLAQCMFHLQSLGLLTEAELWKVGLDNPLEILGVAPSAVETEDLVDFRFAG